MPIAARLGSTAILVFIIGCGESPVSPSPVPVQLTSKKAVQTPEARKIELKPLKYKALCAAVRAQRGQVVVVEIWKFA